MRHYLAILILAANAVLVRADGWDDSGSIGPRNDTGWVIDSVTPLLEDNFSVDRTADNVMGTPADGRTPTQIRTVVDTEKKLSISGGKLVFAGGKTTPGWSDPSVNYPALSRRSGLSILADLKSTFGAGPFVCFSANPAAQVNNDSLYITSVSGQLLARRNGANLAIGTYTVGTSIRGCVSLRSAGSCVFYENSLWKLYWIDDYSSSTPIYPQALSYSASGTVDNLRIPKQTFNVVPLASDSFNRTTLGSTDGAGHAEANGGSGLAWQTGGNNTWSIVGGKLVNSPKLGENLFSNSGFESDSGWSKGAGWSIAVGVAAKSSGTGTTISQTVGEIGGWYQYSFDATRSAGSYVLDHSYPVLSQAANKTYAGTSRELTRVIGIYGDSAFVGTVDNASYKQIPTTDLFCAVQTSSPDVIMDVTINGSGVPNNGTQAGVVLNLDNPSNPQNFVLVYWDGAGSSGSSGTIRVDKCVAGTYTPTANTAVTTYASGKVLRVIHDGSISEYRVFYDNAAVGSVISSIGESGITNNCYHGVFSTSGNASFSAPVVWARGTKNEYQQLDTLK